MSAIMTPADVAQELKATERQVLRLIGLGLLRGTRVGGDQLRITEADLVAYVQQGAPNLRPARFSAEAFPETNGDNFEAGNLRDKVAAWLQQNAPQDAVVQKWAAADKRAGTFDYPANALPADLRAMFSKASPTASMGMGPEKTEPWVLRWGRHILRQTALKVISELPKKGEPFQTLYHDPDQFQTIERATFDKASTQPILTTKVYSIPADRISQPRAVTVNLLLPQSTLFAMLPRAQWTAATW